MSASFDSASSQKYTLGSAPVTAWNLTMCCWFKMGSTTSNCSLLSIGQTGAGSLNQLNLRLLDSGNIVSFARHVSGSGWACNATTAYTADVWNFVAAAGIYTNTPHICVNGTITSSASFNNSSFPSGVDEFAIGARIAASGSYDLYATGLIAEVAIWNGLLGDDRLTALSKGVPAYKVAPGYLVFYAPLIREAIDLKSVALTSGGSPTVGDHPPILYC